MLPRPFNTDFEIHPEGWGLIAVAIFFLCLYLFT